MEQEEGTFLFGLNERVHWVETQNFTQKKQREERRVY